MAPLVRLVQQHAAMFSELGSADPNSMCLLPQLVAFGEAIVEAARTVRTPLGELRCRNGAVQASPINSIVQGLFMCLTVCTNCLVQLHNACRLCCVCVQEGMCGSEWGSTGTCKLFTLLSAS